MKRQHLWWKSFFLSGALTALTIWVVPVFGGAQVSTAEKPNPYVLATPANLLTGYPAVNPDGTINAVVEIPAGTTAKWQVSKRDGTLEWEFLNGKPRIVEYLPYPGNYE